ncbi:acyltransferase family protein [Rhizobium tumorigenes]|uniref:acyltransferase family protein n=1 Tax=Rhizobium tumorigenes TaxID=2041385 RepID=UPI00241FB2DD|nr:acyltransferase [Rhizobium tumorigenes]WFS03306.1 acyltransferase [Rhizobium tumorigenes]
MGASTSTRRRLEHLDGLRGVAAVVVVIFHVMAALAPQMTPGLDNGIASNIYFPFAVAWNGPFSVCIFFVLSGFVVTEAALGRHNPLWIEFVIRFLRLAIPSAASVLFAYLLLKAFPVSASNLFKYTQSPWLSFTYQNSIPGLLSALYDGMAGVFLTGGSLFNNVLWTMRPELIGSMVCFMVSYFRLPQARMAAAIAFGIAFWTVGRFEYECFVLGILLREAWASHNLKASGVPLLILGLGIGSLNGDFSKVEFLSWFDVLLDPRRNGFLYPIGAAMVVYGCLTLKHPIRILSSKTARFLGRISFPIYLIHVPIINTVLAESLRIAFDSVFLTIAVLFLFAIVLAISGSIMSKWLDEPLLKSLSLLRLKLNNLRPATL